MHEGGMAYMRYSISDTAEYGDYTRGPRVIDDHVRGQMKQILNNIRSGGFAREWIIENQAGRPSFLALRRQNQEHLIEKVGGELRGMMPWLQKREEASLEVVQTASPSPAVEPAPSTVAGSFSPPVEPYTPREEPVQPSRSPFDSFSSQQSSGDSGDSFGTQPVEPAEDPFAAQPAESGDDGYNRRPDQGSV
jgi:hypothetical protein